MSKKQISLFGPAKKQYKLAKAQKTQTGWKDNYKKRKKMNKKTQHCTSVLP